MRCDAEYALAVEGDQACVRDDAHAEHVNRSGLRWSDEDGAEALVAAVHPPRSGPPAPWPKED